MIGLPDSERIDDVIKTESSCRFEGDILSLDVNELVSLLEELNSAEHLIFNIIKEQQNPSLH